MRCGSFVLLKLPLRVCTHSILCAVVPRMFLCYWFYYTRSFFSRRHQNTHTYLLGLPARWTAQDKRNFRAPLLFRDAVQFLGGFDPFFFHDMIVASVRVCVMMLPAHIQRPDTALKLYLSVCVFNVSAFRLFVWPTFFFFRFLCVLFLPFVCVSVPGVKREAFFLSFLVLHFVLFAQHKEKGKTFLYHRPTGWITTTRIQNKMDFWRDADVPSALRCWRGNDERGHQFGKLKETFVFLFLFFFFVLCCRWGSSSCQFDS